MKIKKFNSHLVCLLLFFLIGLGDFPGYRLAEAQEKKGKVIGAVIDPINEGRIDNATIEIEGNSLKLETKANQFGEYEVELPPGIYRIIAHIPGYYPFRRAAFRLQAGATTMINIVPILRMTSIGLVVTPEGTRDDVKINPPPQYDDFLPNPSSPEMGILIRYKEKETKDNAIEYNKALISYDTLTIYADRIRFSKNTFHIEAFGRVLIEDGAQRIRATRVEAYIQTRYIIIHKDF